MNNNDIHTHRPPARLSDVERADMQREFHMFMTAHPAVEARRPALSPYVWMFHSPVFYALAIFLMLGGTVYAAEGSLPADLLYPLKIDVIEPIAVQVAPLVGVNQGEVHGAIVERRLKEAETLLDQGKLATSSAILLATKIAVSADAVHSYASSTAGQGNVDDALDASSHLEDVLESHAAILSVVADAQAFATDTTADGLIGVVAAEGDKAEDASEDLEQRLVVASTTQTDDYIDMLKDSATTTIVQLQAGVDISLPNNQELADDAVALLAQAKQYYQSGLAHLARGENDDALSDLREAQSAGEKGLILLDSGSDLSTDGVGADRGVASTSEVRP
jgi:hypothetical protein